MTTEGLKRAVEQFRDDRDWLQFHTPKRLMAAISIEAAELQETMLWSEDVLPGQVDPEIRKRINEEVADVAIFVLSLCAVMGIDLDTAILTKIKKNAEKYPC